MEQWELFIPFEDEGHVVFVYKDMFLFTLHSEEFSCPPQLMETDSYWKNWDLSGTILREAAQKKKKVERWDFSFAINQPFSHMMISENQSK